MEHLADYIAAADELSFDVKLRNRRPIGEILNAPAQRRVAEHVTELRPGDAFYIAPGHDSWVVGDETYVSLHFLGADHYADRS